MSLHPEWTTPKGTIGTFPSQVAMTFTFVATPIAPADTVTYAVLSGSIPDGLTLNATTGVLSGTPAIVGADTIYNFAVRVTDNDDSDEYSIADRTFSLTISGVAIPSFTTPTGTILNTNDSIWIELPIEYSNPVTTNDVSIRVAQGKLPPGLDRGYPQPPVININYSSVATTAVSVTSNVMEVLSTSGFAVDRPIVFTGSVFGGVVANITYFIKTIINSTTFTISASRGGTTLPLIDSIGNMATTLSQVQVGQPTVQTYSFTLELTSVLGNALQSYIIVVANQNAPASTGGPGLPNNTRIPTIYNTRPATFDVGTDDPNNYGYYVFPNDNQNETYTPSQDAIMGQFQSGEYFSWRILGHDFDGDALTYQFADLPLGLVGNATTGWITGTPILANNSISNFTFSVNVRKTNFSNVFSTVFNYQLTIANDILGTVTWVTPADLGTMFNSQTSILAVTATSDVALSYRIASGTLPSNLVLLDNGELSGKVAYQPTTELLALNDKTTFTFTIEAYSPLFPVVHSSREFTLVIEQEFDQPTDTLYIKCAPSTSNRSIIKQLLTSTTIIPTTDLYRAEDSNFGKASNIIYEHAYGIYASDFDEYVAAIIKNHYWRNITLGELKTAVAKNSAGTVVYEVVYSEIQDNLINPKGVSINEDIVWPRKIPLFLGPWYTSETDIYTSAIGASAGQKLQNETLAEEELIASENNENISTEEGQPSYYTSLTPGFAQPLHPNSLVNMRSRVGQNLGQEYDFRLLPDWMTSQQANGSTLGYTPAWVIAYCKPGTSAQIKTNIETLWLDPLGNPYTLNEINFELDRITVDKSITYDYDNNVTPPAWTGLPSATPTPNPKDSKDFHVLFPRHTILPDKQNVSG